MRAPSALALVVLAAAAGPRPARAADEATVEGPSCRLVGHGVAPGVLEACRDGLERAVPEFGRLLPWRLPKDARLVVHLWSDLDGYAEAMRAVGAPELVDNWAATLHATLESHVVLQPRATPEVVALVGGVPEYTLWQVVHEGVHQWLARAGAKNREWWPGWYEEGLCELIAERAAAARSAGGRSPIPADDRAHLVRHALEHDAFLPLARLLHTQVQSFVPERLAYAHAASFVRVLAADEAKFASLAARISALPDVPQGSRGLRVVAMEKAFASALASVYGPPGPLEARWRAAAAKATPAWFEPSRSSQWLPDGRVLVASFPGFGAQLLSTAAPPSSAGFAVSGRFRLLDVGRRQVDLFLGYERRDDARFVKLALGADGYVTLVAYAAGTWQERYRTSVDVEKATFSPGKDVSFRCAVVGGTVRLEVGGRRLFEAEVPPGFDVAHGAWGVGAWDGVAVFDGLAVEAAR